MKFLGRVIKICFVHSLKPAEECVDIPKEVCVRAKVNPRKIKRPIIKKWCYTPKVEGSETEDDTETNDNLENTDDNEETTFAPDDSNDEEQDSVDFRRG